MEVEGVRIIDGLLLWTSSSVAPADGLMLKRLLFWRAVGVGVEGGLILLLGIGTQSTMAIKKLSSNEYNTIKASPLNPSSSFCFFQKWSTTNWSCRCTQCTALFIRGPWDRRPVPTQEEEEEEEDDDIVPCSYAVNVVSDWSLSRSLLSNKSNKNQSVRPNNGFISYLQAIGDPIAILPVSNCKQPSPVEQQKHLKQWLSTAASNSKNNKNAVKLPRIWLPNPLHPSSFEKQQTTSSPVLLCQFILFHLYFIHFIICLLHKWSM